MLQLHFRAIYPFLGALPKAIGTTLGLSALAVCLGFFIGLLVLAARRGQSRPLKWLAVLYIEVMRNTPLIAILYLTYFGLPRLGFRVGGFGSALIALSLNCGAYLAEVFRAGLLAIAPGQVDAARALGLSRATSFRLVIFPQMLRTIYAPFGNVVVQVLLGSSLASVVAVGEIADWMQNVGSETFRYFETFAIAALTYVILCQLVNAARLAVGRLLFASQA
jgi:His/Glu/Gln/Arg/opine family amino acid ABC transporter permease subunit